MKKSELKQVVSKAQAGEVRAFEQIYDAYYDKLAGYALRRVLDQHIAEDVVANVFIKVLEKLPKFKWRHDHSFNGWVYRITSNEINQYFRRQSRYVLSAPRDMEAEYASVLEHNHNAKDLERSIDENIDYMRLHACISELRPKHQDIVHLYYFENLSHKEIAVALKMREGSVRVTLSRITKKLNQLMTGSQLGMDVKGITL
ncbi:MAG: sigma-70 family RNA polymerase sigma factor [Patescibacteria group bacterium]